VELTAGIAKNEPDPYVKAALDFGLLEDFDHLYRYANLMDMLEGTQAENIVGGQTEIIPGRPTVSEHRHPFDDVRKGYDKKKADILTKLHVATITAAEQQTMNYYMNSAILFEDPIARKLYSEIALIEEQHVTHYESLADASTSWFEMQVLHEYNECYLYYSFWSQETDPKIKKLWELHLNMEIEHLKHACQLLQQYEGRDAMEFLPKEFPALTLFESNVDYVRDILTSQIDLTAKGASYIPVYDLPDDYRYYSYQDKINGDGVPSQKVIEQRIDEKGRDYRFELRGPHPIERLREVEMVTR